MTDAALRGTMAIAHERQGDAVSITPDTRLTADEVAPHFDRRTALATIALVREFLLEHDPVDWDREDLTAQEVVAEMVGELRPKIVSSEHWRARLLALLAEEKR
jgi:hypothetical protein